MSLCSFTGPDIICLSNEEFWSPIIYISFWASLLTIILHPKHWISYNKKRYLALHIITEQYNILPGVCKCINYFCLCTTVSMKYTAMLTNIFQMLFVCVQFVDSQGTLGWFLWKTAYPNILFTDTPWNNKQQAYIAYEYENTTLTLDILLYS